MYGKEGEIRFYRVDSPYMDGKIKKYCIRRMDHEAKTMENYGMPLRLS
jgi:hypothetical protein